ncbi:MAG: protein-disulfide reductase DsbD [Gammaproteobacteria bacterium]|nr:protein-disulfide reductase DsbD [Gammaproteobacteria bacterium]MBU2057387.1 protein-disulfide reductase DsbD [Gammaproteobacteria bacterium]MBU2176885.1 protein-disulfide reductase DsbD [Gammaproteobacteria bacterium]MBU2247997.1 protein-disulfide reductase DsbD [Gammaproteobacteria bacterium]MBU2392147.1 protein-disulfide reductase DsbD [Gammaproteobacteria bacterium]
MIKSFLFSLLLSLSFISQAQSTSVLAALQQDSQFLPVEQAFVMDFRQQENKLQVSFTIADGYYLYKDKFKFVGIDAAFSHPQYPKGVMIHDEYFGESEVYFHQVVLDIPLSQLGSEAMLKVRFQGCAEAGLCYPVQTLDIPLIAPASTTSASATDAVAALGMTDNSSSSITSSAPVSEQLQLLDKLQTDSTVKALFLFFLLGLGLAFTPCVFPMYPILTSIIVGQGQQLSGKRAFSLSMAYVQGMAVSYSLLGLLVASLGLQFQTYFQHPVVLVAISILFVVLALAMFGVFHLSLPEKWQNKVNSLSNKQQGGSIKGAALMGLLSGLVASPCTTAPLTAALLYVAQSGDLALGALTLYILSMGMGLPLLILGSTGGKFLPKAGAWMDVVKASFGFLLLAVPVWLLSRFLPTYIVVIAGTLVLLMLAVYLHRLSQQLVKGTSGQSISWMLALVIVLGTTGANLWYWLPSPVVVAGQAVQTQNTEFTLVKTLDELQQQVKKSADAGKPVLVDLYADWCVACKEFEHITFADGEVESLMAQFTLIKVDVTHATDQDQQLLDHFQVLGLPTLLLFDKNGSELTQSRITGFMGPKDFSAHLGPILQ